MINLKVGAVALIRLVLKAVNLWVALVGKRNTRTAEGQDGELLFSKLGGITCHRWMSLQGKRRGWEIWKSWEMELTLCHTHQPRILNRRIHKFTLICPQIIYPSANQSGQRDNPEIQFQNEYNVILHGLTIGILTWEFLVLKIRTWVGSCSIRIYLIDFVQWNNLVVLLLLSTQKKNMIWTLSDSILQFPVQLSGDSLSPAL